MNILNTLMESFNFEQFTFTQLVVSLSFSALMGILGMLAYRLYHRKNEAYDLSISRGFPLLTPAVTSIFWLIQTSLPLSLGLLGALSFVRFRAPVKRAEDIAFILIMISTGLSCAIKQFHVGAMLIGFVFAFAFLRRKIAPRFFSAASGNIAVHSQDAAFVQKMTDSQQADLKDLVLVSMTSRDGLASLFFSGPALDLATLERIKKAILALDARARVEFFFPDNQVG